MIAALKDRVRAFNERLESGALVKKVIEDNDAEICDMNAKEQLYEQGINRLGVDISDYAPYSPITIDIKKLKGQPTNRVTLRDEGDFHSSFYVVATDTSFEVKAKDAKAEHLLSKYGSQILGLTRENLMTLVHEYIYPNLLRDARTMLL